MQREPITCRRVSDALAEGPDGLPRCSWAVSAPEYIAYHDQEWGRPVRSDQGLYERMCLEAFQSGLAWITILRKRAGFRAAFAGFEIARVAAFGEQDVERLMADAAIVRNRAKIEATIGNARAFLEVRREFGTFDAYLWRFVAGRPVQNAWRQGPPAESEASRSLSRDLRERGFRFVGPTICYAFMQAAGLVNDHSVACFRWRQVARLG
jgi:DNA-3-methyladenine glycosylase I